MKINNRDLNISPTLRQAFDTKVNSLYKNALFETQAKPEEIKDKLNDVFKKEEKSFDMNTSTNIEAFTAQIMEKMQKELTPEQFEAFKNNPETLKQIEIKFQENQKISQKIIDETNKEIDDKTSVSNENLLTFSKEKINDKVKQPLVSYLKGKGKNILNFFLPTLDSKIESAIDKKFKWRGSINDKAQASIKDLSLSPTDLDDVKYLNDKASFSTLLKQKLGHEMDDDSKLLLPQLKDPIDKKIDDLYLQYKSNHQEKSTQALADAKKALKINFEKIDELPSDKDKFKEYFTKKMHSSVGDKNIQYIENHLIGLYGEIHTLFEDYQKEIKRREEEEENGKDKEKGSDVISYKEAKKLNPNLDREHYDKAIKRMARLNQVFGYKELMLKTNGKMNNFIFMAISTLEDNDFSQLHEKLLKHSPDHKTFFLNFFHDPLIAESVSTMKGKTMESWSEFEKGVQDIGINPKEFFKEEKEETEDNKSSEEKEEEKDNILEETPKTEEKITDKEKIKTEISSDNAQKFEEFKIEQINDEQKIPTKNEEEQNVIDNAQTEKTEKIEDIQKEITDKDSQEDVKETEAEEEQNEEKKETKEEIKEDVKETDVDTEKVENEEEQDEKTEKTQKDEEKKETVEEQKEDVKETDAQTEKVENEEKEDIKKTDVHTEKIENEEKEKQQDEKKAEEEKNEEKQKTDEEQKEDVKKTDVHTEKIENEEKEKQQDEKKVEVEQNEEKQETDEEEKEDIKKTDVHTEKIEKEEKEKQQDEKKAEVEKNEEKKETDEEIKEIIDNSSTQIKTDNIEEKPAEKSQNIKIKSDIEEKTEEIQKEPEIKPKEEAKTIITDSNILFETHENPEEQQEEEEVEEQREETEKDHSFKRLIKLKQYFEEKKKLKEKIDEQELQKAAEIAYQLWLKLTRERLLDRENMTLEILIELLKEEASENQSAQIIQKIMDLLKDYPEFQKYLLQILEALKKEK